MGGQSNASHPQVGNLSLPTYKGDKQMNQAIYECLGKKSKSPYLRGGRTNQAAHECLGKKSKSSYLGVCMGWVGSS